MSDQDPREGPPKPRLTLRVGITGKRAIPASETGRIGQAFGTVFEALAAFLAERNSRHPGLLADDVPLLRVITGMAEGADQIAAEVATRCFDAEQKAQPRIIETEVAAILPFVREEYEKDFAQDPNRPKGQQQRTPEEHARAVARFGQLLEHLAVKTVLEISDEALFTTGRPEDRNAAYANLRDVLLQHCDILVAVSDDVYGGAGGTVDVIRISVSEQIPVIRISTTTPEIHVMRAADVDAPDQTPREDEELASSKALPEKLATSLGRLLEPPAPPARAMHEEAAAHLEESHPARDRLELFFGEDFKIAYFGRTFKAFRDALAVTRKPGENVFAAGWAAFRAAWKKYAVDPPDESARSIWRSEYDAFARDGGARAREILAKRYGWADALAVRYADVTRSSHIVIATLGALAVLVGLLTVFVPDKPEDIAVKIKVAALLLEAGILLLAARQFFGPAHAKRWHERMVEYRAVAELLRHERFIYALGAADRPGRAQDRTWSEPDAWVGWYVRATLRELGFPGKVLSAQERRKVMDAFAQHELYLKTGEYEDGQIPYNAALAQRFHTIDARLEDVVIKAFWFAFIVAVVGAVVLLGLGWMVWNQLPGAAIANHVIHGMKPVLTVILAFVPALIAAIHGIRFQLEFKSAANRAGATKRELQEIFKDVTAALAAPAPSPGRKQSIILVRSANEAMSSDLAGWSNVYRGKGPELA